jgi:outer membrane receptor protein involved in Fe transport
MLQIPSGTGTANPAVVNQRIANFLAYPLAPQNARAADWDIGRNLKHNDGFEQVSLRTDYRLAPQITLTSITAYSYYRENYGLDRDGTTLLNAGVTANGRVREYDQELRLSGKTGPTNWVIGGNYQDQSVFSANHILTGDSTNTAILPGGPFIADSVTTITQYVRQYAVFGNVEYALTDTLSVLGGARYTENRNDYSACMVGDAGMQATFGYLSTALGGTTNGPVGPDTCLNLSAQTFQLIRTPFHDKLDQDNVSWRAGVNYKPSRDLLVYATATRGYKSGSFPTVPASTTKQLSPVTQESVTAYEAGAKLTALDRTLQLNGAVFYYTYDNKQVRGIIIDPVFNQLEQLVNIPRSSIRGAEIEATSTPMRGLTLRAAATYVDSRVDKFTGINNARVFANYAGSALPFSPTWNVVADAEYRWDMSDALEGFVGGNILYNSKSNSTLGDPLSSRITAFTTLDLRAGVNSADRRWSLWLWGKNVTNTYYWTNQFVTQDVVVRYAAMPATYGVTFRVNFK